jgi:DNA (cytosine-5)-methyltransferase 1
MKTIKVIELFAGVGGFRIGLERANNKELRYETVWNSQWEPSTKTQHASDIYKNIFGAKGHSCEDIKHVVDKKFEEIKKHKGNLLVGGFPCQDYSVARTLKKAKGIEGKKGVLFWSIYKILKKSGEDAPDFLMLENVDRLLKSPVAQRGRDFAVMLASLNELGYAGEWRVINAAEYGMPQRRRRVYILGFKKGTKIYEQVAEIKDFGKWFTVDGVIAKQFKIKEPASKIKEILLEKDVAKVSKNFSKEEAPKISPFANAGVMIDGEIHTTKVEPSFSGKKKLLKDILEPEENVEEEFFLNPKDLKKWKDLKGAKKQPRKTKDGFEYMYSEGGMIFPDNLENASRTIVTGEGGSSPSRFKHVVETESGRLRRLMPIELERLNMFEPNHTKYMLSENGEKVLTSNTKRAFIMGNALVVGVITKLGRALCSSM